MADTRNFLQEVVGRDWKQLQPSRNVSLLIRVCILMVKVTIGMKTLMMNGEHNYGLKWAFTLFSQTFQQNVPCLKLIRKIPLF